MDFFDPNPDNSPQIAQENLGSAGQSSPGYMMQGTQYNTPGGDINTFMPYVPDNADWLTSFGFGGPGQVNQGGEGGSPETNPELLKYLQDKQFKLGQMFNPNYGGSFTTRAFDQNNKGVGGSYTYQDDNGIGSPFDYALQGLVGAFGAYAGGATAAGYGAGAAGQATASGAMAGGLAGGVGSAGDPRSSAIGAATGAAGGAVAGMNPAGAVGITDPNYSRYFNNAVGSGAKAAIGGGDVGKAVGGSLVNSGLNYGENAMFGNSSYSPADTNTDSWDFNAPSQEQNFSPVPQQGNAFTNMMGYSPAPAQGNPLAFGSAGYNPTQMDGSEVQAPQQNKAQSNPLMDFARRHLSFGSAGATGTGGFGNDVGNLLQMYQSYKNKGQYAGLARNLEQLYSPNSPYAQQLKQNLMRQDAASGRRSQYGAREVELQARLAGLNAQMAPQLQSLYGQGQNNNAQILQSAMRLGNSPSARNGLMSLFGNSGAAGGGYVPSNSPYNGNYENQMDQGFSN